MSGNMLNKNIALSDAAVHKTVFLITLSLGTLDLVDTMPHI
jgi:hypothetical protein